ncbi:hypothetical protein [Campylobacter rectus]|uniref:hypothetical protein n=1 Tax=Campylobacter rectus TaxID=203 RepID=UPI0023F03148|nr:hypothetical protein [Campylobacter rectus]
MERVKFYSVERMDETYIGQVFRDYRYSSVVFIAPPVVISLLASVAYTALNSLANLFKETCYFVAPLRLFSIFMR